MPAEESLYQTPKGHFKAKNSTIVEPFDLTSLPTGEN
jgi:hypothetical protein